MIRLKKGQFAELKGGTMNQVLDVTLVIKHPLLRLIRTRKRRDSG